MRDFWQNLGRRSRLGLVFGAIAIVTVVAATGWWMMRADYQVLFADLKPQDASVMTAELDRLKIPYLLGDGGTSLLVDKADVHATRIKLMGRELPLHGAVGFELFNNTDFGMTEFAQKVNYQRALQGELTRTILSLSEVRDARVHLALPEQGLFKQAASRPKASIALTLRPGQALRAEQVGGIQRLVAAAVPGMTMEDVTILDHGGIALSRPGNEDDAGIGSARLDLKRDAENYLSRKAGAVLERAFGPGQVLASVDVTLNLDQVRVTTEDVIPAPQVRGGVPMAGIVVRERESIRESGPLERAANGAPPLNGSSQRETEYQVGRRVEQVVSQPGSIRRIQVVALVRQALDARQEEQVRKLLAAAVGASPERGDTVVVQTLDSLPGQGPAAALAEPARAEPGSIQKQESPLGNGGPGAGQPDDQARGWTVVGVVVAAVLCVVLASLLFRRTPRHGGTPPMTAHQRDAALRQVRDWMQTGAPPREAPHGRSVP